MSLQMMRTESGVIKKRDEVWAEIQNHLIILFRGSEIEYIYKRDGDLKYALYFDGRSDYGYKFENVVSKWDNEKQAYMPTVKSQRLGSDLLPEQFCIAVMDAYKSGMKGKIVIMAGPDQKPIIGTGR
jgi:hypothetical protein